MEELFVTSEAAKALGIERQQLANLSTRGHIEADVRGARGVCGKACAPNQFQRETIYETAVLLRLMDWGLIHNNIRLYMRALRRAKGDTSLSSYHFATFKLGDVPECTLSPHPQECATYLPEHTLIINCRDLCRRIDRRLDA